MTKVKGNEQIHHYGEPNFFKHASSKISRECPVSANNISSTFVPNDTQWGFITDETKTNICTHMGCVTLYQK